MRTYIFFLIFLASSLGFAQTPKPTPTPATKMYLGHEVSTAPPTKDELEVVNQIKAHKMKIRNDRLALIKEGKLKPNKWDLKYMEELKAKGGEVEVPTVVAPKSKTGSDNVDEEFKALVEKRQKRNEKLAEEAKRNAEATPVPEVTPAPSETKELSEEEQKYLKEKEEFLKKFKKQN